MNKVEGQFVDIFSRKIFPAAIHFFNEKIQRIERLESAPSTFILPGFVDAHVHIESSMLTPNRFAEIALLHGTVATVSDPHEIANVCGLDGIRFMIDSAKEAALKIHFGAPSCVPATHLETAGAKLDANDIETLMSWPEIYYLAEVMNFPAVLSSDEEMRRKLDAAKNRSKPIDGHAPGMNASDSAIYFAAGINTDHECVALEEAVFKIENGCKILIREGSAAKNFDALISLFSSNPEQLMFCSDDLHPDDLLSGHINLLVRRAVALGYNLFDVLYAACVHPVLHYRLRSGLCRVGDSADFIVVEDLENFSVKETWIDGRQVASSLNKPKTFFEKTINNFSAKVMQPDDFKVSTRSGLTEMSVRVIEAIDKQLITNEVFEKLKIDNGQILSNSEIDILKIAIINRYQISEPFVGFIKNIGIKDAAIASSVSHDSHNIVVVGTSDELLAKAANAIIAHQGGISFASNDEVDCLPLPIAGLMSSAPATEVAAAYERLNAKAKRAGSKLTAPFMTLSFMALPVIPKLKVTDLGLVDTDLFDFVALES